MTICKKREIKDHNLFVLNFRFTAECFLVQTKNEATMMINKLLK